MTAGHVVYDPREKLGPQAKDQSRVHLGTRGPGQDDGPSRGRSTRNTKESRGRRRSGEEVSWEYPPSLYLRCRKELLFFTLVLHCSLSTIASHLGVPVLGLCRPRLRFSSSLGFQAPNGI